MNLYMVSSLIYHTFSLLLMRILAISWRLEDNFMNLFKYRSATSNGYVDLRYLNTTSQTTFQYSQSKNSWFWLSGSVKGGLCSQGRLGMSGTDKASWGCQKQGLSGAFKGPGPMHIVY